LEEEEEVFAYVETEVLKRLMLVREYLNKSIMAIGRFLLTKDKS